MYLRLSFLRRKRDERAQFAKGMLTQRKLFKASVINDVRGCCIKCLFWGGIPEYSLAVWPLRKYFLLSPGL